MKNYKDIVKYGLLPQFGDTVKDAYNGYYNLDNDDTEYDEDDENKPVNLDFDGLLFFSEYPMLHYSYNRNEKFDINKALVCVIKKNDTIFHKIEDYPKYTDYRGKDVKSINYHSVYELPIMIETGDWFSFEEQYPVKLLQGKYIIEFMKKNFLKEYEKAISLR
jgi:hypothetical protein